MQSLEHGVQFLVHFALSASKALFTERLINILPLVTEEEVEEESDMLALFLLWTS